MGKVLIFFMQGRFCVEMGRLMFTHEYIITEHEKTDGQVVKPDLLALQFVPSLIDSTGYGNGSLSMWWKQEKNLACL